MLTQYNPRPVIGAKASLVRANPLLGFGLIAALIAGCAPLPDGVAPHFPFAQNWATPSPATPRLLDDALWWQGFRNAPLDGLIARALAGNPGLAAAQARSKSAYAAAQAVPGAVQASGGLGAEASGGSLANNSGEASGDFTLEILFDPGRGRESERRAVRGAAGLATAQAAGARLFLINEVTDAYLTLRYDQKRLALTQAGARRQQQTLKLAHTLAEAGESTRIEVLRSQAGLASLDAQLPAIEASIGRSLARLAVLAGDAPGALPPNLQAALQAMDTQPRATLLPDPGIPADLIRNRPDIQAAEASYDIAVANLGQARAALYPRLSIAGTIEAQRSFGAGGSSAVSVGPSLRFPALPLGPAKAGVTAATGRVEAAYADWTSTVLQALYEVEAALLDYRAAARTETATDRAVALHKKTTALTRDAASAGEATLGDLITVEAALAQAEAAQAEARLTRAQAFMQLNIRLGSGSRAPATRSSTLAPPAPVK